MLTDPMRRASTPLVLVAVLLGGCGGGSGAKDVPSRAQARQQLHGSPAALAGLHAQAGDLLGGGSPAFQRRMLALRGHAVIVNKWAAWCAPCRLEFPVLQRVSVKLGKQVAFLGLDARDRTAAARGFLRTHPTSYPSYVDPREAISRSQRAPEGMPITNFYDADGALVYQHAGPYTTDKALEADVRKYLPGS
jgi:cytochrome c biogenesis protein CcmG, thiol:disulfide interchange protein DsbE